MVPYSWLTEIDGTFPAPGRRSTSFEQARTLLVDDANFSTSITRPALWEGLERYLVRFFVLEDKYASLLGAERLVRLLWLGGAS